MIEQLRYILESQEDVGGLMADAGLPAGFDILLADLRRADILSTGSKALNLKELDDILLAYWAGSHAAEQLSLLKTALLKDDATAMVFIKRLRDHAQHIQAGRSGEERELALDVLVKRGKGLHASTPAIRKQVAVWALSVAATFLILFLWPGHSIYDDFNFDQEPPLLFQTDVQRNAREYRVDSTSVDSFFVNGMKAYLACDYEQALASWSRQPANGQYDRLVRLYSALSYLSLSLSEENRKKDNTGSISRAVSLFQGLQADMSDQERYYYALALILADRDAEARQQLNRIASPGMRVKVEALSIYLD